MFFFSDDESETATEGEEEIRARELRKQEVRVEPPVVQTDTGTDTEVKSSFQINPVLSAIQSNYNYLNPHPKNLNNSSDNISINSTEYNSAESGDLDLNMNKISEVDKKNVIVGNLIISSSLPLKTKESSDESTHQEKNIENTSIKSPKNFDIQKNNNISSEFVSKFPPPETQALLIIRRTPSKISLPKEVGKPKTVVNTNILDTAKYFGAKNKPPLKRSGTISTEKNKPVLVKQTSLPETADEIKEVKSFNFEPEDSDLKEIDNYIENLIANEDELYKPIDPNKYKLRDSPSLSEEEKCSSSIEDLLKALENDTEKKNYGTLETKDEDNIDDLLTWMDSLDHQGENKKYISKSFSDAKYKNLEKNLKMPTKSDAIISKIPKQNISLFESHLLGKESLLETENDNNNTENKIGSFALTRSKTEVACNRNDRPRSSVDLEAVSKVDIKKMLQKFEEKGIDQKVKERSKSPVKILRNRRSFAAFRSFSAEKEPLPKIKPLIPKTNPVKHTIKMFEFENTDNQNAEKGKPPKFRSISSSPEKRILRAQSLKCPHKLSKCDKSDNISSNKAFNDLEKFVAETLLNIGNKYDIDCRNNKQTDSDNWCANVTVKCVQNNSFPADTIQILENEKKNALDINNADNPMQYEQLSNNMKANLGNTDIKCSQFANTMNLPKTDNKHNEEYTNEDFEKKSNNIEIKQPDTSPEKVIPYSETHVSQIDNTYTNITNDPNIKSNGNDTKLDNDRISFLKTLLSETEQNTEDINAGKQNNINADIGILTSNEQHSPIINEAINSNITISNDNKNLKDNQDAAIVSSQNDCDLYDLQIQMGHNEVSPVIVETINNFVKVSSTHLSQEEIDSSDEDEEDSVRSVDRIHSPHDFSKAIDSTDTSIVEENYSKGGSNKDQIFNPMICIVAESKFPESFEEHLHDSGNMEDTLETELETSHDSDSNAIRNYNENYARLDLLQTGFDTEQGKQTAEKTSENQIDCSTENSVVEALSTKIYKGETPSPPLRLKKNKKNEGQQPLRPTRQKSLEKNIFQESEMPPIPPQRRMTPKNSPLPTKKTDKLDQHTSDFKREITKLSFIPKPQTVKSRSISPDSSTSNPSRRRDRSKSRESDVECCIQ